ncbi:MAG TPA: GntR family transcriptional regulator [Bradyrhizobium sp.]|nr:GntR family transcriptional regulator [Bradyrhizobium sp.]
MLHEDVVGRVRAMLLEGEIPPGARIPERDLCEKLQISRTPLREALKVLAAEGLVQLLPNRGSRAAKLTDKDMHDLFEVCQGLEALAGELACERITDAEIADIAAAHAAMARHYRDNELLQYYRCNRCIHEAIIAGAGNPVLSGLYDSVTARIRRARYVTPMTPDRWALALQEHEAILNALQRRDGVGLAHILRAHLRHKREEVLQAGFAETEQRGVGHASLQRLA